MRNWAVKSAPYVGVRSIGS